MGCRSVTFGSGLLPTTVGFRDLRLSSLGRTVFGGFGFCASRIPLFGRIVLVEGDSRPPEDRVTVSIAGVEDTGRGVVDPCNGGPGGRSGYFDSAGLHVTGCGVVDPCTAGLERSSCRRAVLVDGES